MRTSCRNRKAACTVWGDPEAIAIRRDLSVRDRSCDSHRCPGCKTPVDRWQATRYAVVMLVALRTVDPSLPLPRYESAGAAAFDVVTRLTTVVSPRSISLVPGNVIIKVPDGYALLIVARSSLPRKKGLLFPHAVGVIDQDYHGDDDEIMVQVYNFTEAPVTVERGERIAQGLFVRIDRADWQIVGSHHQASRGGFGTTGTHS